MDQKFPLSDCYHKPDVSCFSAVSKLLCLFQVTPPHQIKTTHNTSGGSPYLILPPKVTPPLVMTPPLGGSLVSSSTPSSAPKTTAAAVIDFSSKRTVSKPSQALSNLKFAPAPVHQVVESKSRGDRDTSPVEERTGGSSPMAVASNKRDLVRKWWY